MNRRSIVLTSLVSVAAIAAIAFAGMPQPDAGRASADTIAAAGARTTTAPPAPPRTAATAVLVELFTSQGCSSCPPADVVLEQIAADPAVVAISRNVTYWDRLGWRDSLGREANTALQRRYAARGVDGGEVYTPQAVVNGASGVIGSHANELRRAIGSAAATRPVHLRITGQSVSTESPTNGAELRFIAVAARRNVRVDRGENGGRTLSYHNVVIDEALVSCAAAGACSAELPATVRNARGADRWAVVLQRRGGGAVLAARWLP